MDFLVEDGTQPRGTRMVDDVTASVMPGVVRALETAREVRIAGPDLYGANQKVIARVCEVGPFLVLKLRALLHRQAGKDAYEVLYTLLHFDGGTDAAVEAFAIEAGSGNPAFPDAHRALETLFANERSPGPVKAAHFVFGPPLSTDSDDARTRRLQVQQDAVSAASSLMKSLS